MKFLLAFGIFFGTLLLCAQASDRRPRPQVVHYNEPLSKKIPQEGLLTKLCKLVNEGIGVEPGWEIRRDDRPRVQETACELWIRVGDNVVGLEEGLFVTRKGIPSIFHAGQCMAASPESIYPTNIKFDLLMRKLRERVAPKLSPEHDILRVLDHFIGQADQGTIQLSGDGFDAMMVEIPPLREAVLAVAPELLAKMFPKLSAMQATLEDKLLMFPVAFIEARRMYNFAFQCYYATLGSYGQTHANGDLGNRLSKFMKTMVPNCGDREDELPTSDLFLLASASIALNGGRLVPDDASVAVSVLNLLYNVQV